MSLSLKSTSEPGLRLWRPRIPKHGALILLLLATAAIAWGTGAAVWFVALLFGLDLAYIVWAAQAGPGLRILGPLFVYDLARLARRGRTTLLRATYAALLLGWLYVLLSDHVPATGVLDVLQQSAAMSLSEWAEFARRYAIALLSLQTGAVLLLTPAYLSGALTEEKERRTLELLFATPLYDRELLLGKLFGRMLHLGIVLLAALPIFGMTRIWGGVDDDLLMGGLTVTFMTILSVSGISILCSVLFRTVLGALIASYVAVFILNVSCLAIPATSPVLFVPAWNRDVDEAWQAWQKEMEFIQPESSGLKALYPPPNPTRMLLLRLIPFILIHGLIFLVCTIVAIVVLRRCCLAPGEVMLQGVLPKDKAVIAWDPAPWLGAESRFHLPVGVFSPKPIQEPALMWKEMVHGTTATPGPGLGDWLLPVWRQILVFLAFLACVSLFLFWRAAPTWGSIVTAFNGLIRSLTVVLAGLWCLMTAFRAAGCVSRERDQQTLDGLLALPGERIEILRAKWLGSILRYRQLGYTLAVSWVLGLAIGALHPSAVVLLVAACTAHLAFLASFGLWLSVVSRNTLWANMRMAFVFMLLFMGSWLGWAVDEPVARIVDAGWFRRLLEVRVAPGYAWWFVAFSWTDLSKEIATRDGWLAQAFLQALAGLPLFGGGAYLFWKLACRRFQDEKSWRRR